MPFQFDNRPSDSPYVDLVWQARTDESSGFVSSAAIHWGMVVVKHEDKLTLHVRGPETQASQAEFHLDYEFLGINFKFGTYMPHLSPKTIIDRQDLVMPEVASRTFQLNSSSWEFPTFENADTFVGRLVREGILAYEPVVNEVLQGQPTDYSPRAVQYRFLHATGLTQSTVHQIQRARRAKALLIQGKPILDTVYEAGYFDQAHLTRSLKRFMGQTPTQLGDEPSSP